MAKQYKKIFLIAIIMLFWVGNTFAQTERWVYTYNGPANSSDQAFSVVYGGDGNIYAAGISKGSGTGFDFTVISIDTAGVERWVYRYDGPGNGDDRAYSIIYGADGNIYAAGYSLDSVNFSDFTVISLDTTGTERWIYKYNGPGNMMDGAKAILYGADGNIYAAGHSSGITTYKDFTVISLTNTGNERWVYRHNGLGSGTDEAYSICYGDDGNIYVAGYDETATVGTDHDFTIISLNNIGTENWIYWYEGPGDATDEAYSVVYGLDGNIYASGYSSGISTSPDFTVIGLTNTGTIRWAYRYTEPSNNMDVAFELVYGADNNIYATGYRNGAAPPFADIMVAGLTNSGAENWLYWYNGHDSSMDFGNSLVYGADGYIYVAGYSYSSVTGFDIAVISLDNTGIESWVYKYNGQDSLNDQAFSIVYGEDGNIYAAGCSESNSTGTDFIVISLAGETGIEEHHDSKPFSDLLQNTPNPFKQMTDIRYQISEPTYVSIKVYNIAGQMVRTLVSGIQESGTHSVVWKGENDTEEKLAHGVYFYTLEFDDQTITKKTIMLK